ncbi:hypothetical protein VM1G_09135 [Cytospora mali]|uniref:Endoplasmic reticulum membrane protein 65 n=1 Tax=Cytospora mali TaxID=578113 RepID=A0A194WB55_CYTMA|nr:hypothetical protein VM1G_09135 [Valsa mali]
MAASEAEMSVLAPTDGHNQDGVHNNSNKGGVETRPVDGVENGNTTTPKELSGMVNDENKTLGPVTASLPSPAPSLSDIESSFPPFASLANGQSSYPYYFKRIDASTDSTSLDGFESCAVSEADTSAVPSAVESSTDALPRIDGIHTTPKRSSSSAKKTRGRSGTKSSDHSGIRRLSASKIQELTASPESLPIATVSDQPVSAEVTESHRPSMAAQLATSPQQGHDNIEPNKSHVSGDTLHSRILHSDRPVTPTGTLHTPPVIRRKSSSQPPAPPSASRRNSFQPSPRPAPLNLEAASNLGPVNPPNAHHRQGRPDSRDIRELREPRAPSPIPPSVPLPPLSAPTLLQLELAAQRPSPLYIHHSYASDLPYESSAVKFERLKNFLLIPPYIEKTLMFGALACLDAWLWTFTILPMRFCIAFSILFRWWGYVIAKEAQWLVGFVWEGLGRMRERCWRGRKLSRGSSHDSSRSTDGGSRSRSRASEPPKDTHAGVSSSGHSGSTGDLPRRADSVRLRADTNTAPHMPPRMHSRSHRGPFRHRRTKSMPSSLTSFHKADLLQGLVIICSSIALMNLDASRMYHFIRAQSAVKLYVIYNLVEVGDRLLSALGQDIFECLFSSETLSRNSSGRSKVMLPFGMFLLSLVYNCAHAITLFYQVITLNVAVNSYSNALLTLLMSNQFVEIKGSVFKRFEKENLFQLTCADVVERFQLWLVLLIIGMRNVVEVGGLSVPGAGVGLGDDPMATAKAPLHSSSILPMSFTILPSWLRSGEVLSPFLIVIGSEMLVDWIKHAYINKFNNIKPNFYSRILDILCKDYYTNAFVTPSLTRRLGLPLLPLSTLFIRASFQTYRMFLATHLPAPMPPSTQTSLSVESSTASSPAVTAALDRLDNIIRNALGRSIYGFEGDLNNTTTSSTSSFSFLSWSTDDVIALVTMLLVFFIAFLVLLIVKLLLGMLLLRYSRDRYAKMKMKEHAVATSKMERETFDTKGSKRVGGFGAVEVGDDRRRWIFADDPEGLKKARDRERKAAEGGDGKGEKDLSGVMRYEMVAKRIW